MSKNTRIYSVVGATGQVGRGVAEGLLAAGHQVRVLTRDPARAEDLRARGAQVQVGELSDVAYLMAAFQGADAVFTMLPPSYGAPDYRAVQDTIGQATRDALEATRVRHVVNLSSVGAHLDPREYDTGVIAGLHDQERRLASLGEVNVLNLRPGYFMENLMFTLEPIRSLGIAGSPLRGDLKLPMIATRDIASAAVEALLRLDFRGQSARELLGQRDVSMEEVTAAVAAATSKTSLHYVAFPYEAAAEAMVSSGLSADTAKRLIAMYKGYNDGWLAPLSPRTPASTTVTTIENYAREFAALVTTA